MRYSVLGVAFSAAALLGAVAGPGIKAQSASQTGRTQVTFTKDVASILQRSCQDCHRAGSIGPMALLTYEDVRPYARAIKTKVATRDMPPWFIDRTVGIQKFKRDPSLSDAQIATVVAWVDQGAPRGNPADMPPPRKFEDATAWQIGKPDLVVPMPKELVVPAESPDIWQNILTASVLTEDRYIKAVEVKPLKGFTAVHHAVVSMRDEEGNGSLLAEYAVGKNGDIFPEGTGRLIKAGTRFNFNMHLHATGEEVPTQVAVGLMFYPKGYVPKYAIVSSHMGDNGDIDIPANSITRHDGYTTLKQAARIVGVQPHLHNRGTAQCIEAILPTPVQELGTRGQNETITLTCVDRYQFGWHIVYNYEDDVQPILPAGTVIHVTSWHDNTANNKYNPDPSNWVGYGERTVDDMSFAWMNYYFLTDAEYLQMVKERKARTGK
jgi:hypothetical protein